MTNAKSIILPLLTVGCIAVVFPLTRLVEQAPARAQSTAGGPAPQEEDADRDENRAALEREVEEIERQLNVLEREIEKAQEADARQRVEELRDKAEPLIDRLEEIVRVLGESEDEEGEEEQEELEERARHIRWRQMELSLERAQLEARSGRLQADSQMANIAQSSTTAATYAVLHLHEYVEHAGAADVLAGIIKDVEDAVIRRVIRMQLAELYREMDRPDDAAMQLKRLIVGR